MVNEHPQLSPFIASASIIASPGFEALQRRKASYAVECTHVIVLTADYSVPQRTFSAPNTFRLCSLDTSNPFASSNFGRSADGREQDLPELG